MSESHEPESPSPAVESEPDLANQERVREMLRGALPEPEAAPDLVRGVQQKIRARSRGKFYADGWSTVKHPPVNTYLATSLMMLFVLAVVYALLHPLSGEPARPSPAAPVNVVAPVGS